MKDYRGDTRTITMSVQELHLWLCSYFQKGFLSRDITWNSGKGLTDLTHQAWDDADKLIDLKLKEVSNK